MSCPSKRRVIPVLRTCLADDGGQVVVEYALLTMLVTLGCLYLINPENGIYAAIRLLFDFITLTLYLPGP